MTPLVLVPGKIVKKGEYIATDTIKLNPGDYVYFEPGSRVVFEFSEKKSAFEFTSDNKFEAHGSVFEMNYTGDLATLNVDDKGPHLLDLRGAKNCTVLGGEYNKAAGDSIYIGPRIVGTERIPCENITVEFVKCHSSRRQGISITSAKDVLVRGCHFENIKGASPQAAIDVEPSHFKDFIERVLIKACRAVDCGSHAFTVNVTRFIESNYVSVDFEDISIYDMGVRSTVRVSGMGPEDPTRPKGYVRVTNANMLWKVE